MLFVLCLSSFRRSYDGQGNEVVLNSWRSDCDVPPTAVRFRSISQNFDVLMTNEIGRDSFFLNGKV